MIDSYTYAIKGWKITGRDNVHTIYNELDDICSSVYGKEDIYEILDGFIIEDSMCGEYLYFGAILNHFNNNENSTDFIIDTKLIAEKVSKFNKMCKDYPEIKKMFDYSIENGLTEYKEEQLYITLHIY